jgi:hypothetical protein
VSGDLWQATCTTSTLPPGPHPITAAYSGDSDYTASTSNTVEQRVVVSTATELASSKNPSDLGHAVTFTATVSPANGGGTVTFTDGAAALCPDVPLTQVSGDLWQATCTTSTLPPGPHPITATYRGDDKYRGSTSNTVEQKVLVPTSTRLASSKNPSHPRHAVTFTATIRPTNGGGTVTFTDGTATLCLRVPLTQVSGDFWQATCTTSTLRAGSHTITATYSGDISYAGSSGSITQRVRWLGTGLSASTMSNAASRPR